MIADENRLKCIDFEPNPTLARAPAADLFNMVLDDGLLVWPALGITIPLDEVPYEAIKNAWASDSESLPIDVDLPADRPPVIEEHNLWPDEQSTPESDLLTTRAER
ncbi:hypothetical protein PYU99_06720 [Aeromonas media]|uniref:hypothetical protein n=1 Tax=Aeromonas TaxID=642 RepID=UPI0022E2521B|nr:MULTISPECIES: hypothetical protein [Aeromonas]WED82628.1 hypothetical protein PYU99_06720 [Aeromonas media]